MPTDIVIAGACFIDLISYVPRLPVAGETIPGTDFQQGFGGKGANQAVLIGKLGGSVGMLSALGNDANGKSYLDELAKWNVNSDGVMIADTYTGNAPIMVVPSGENVIVINQGAALRVTPEHLSTKLRASGAKFLVCQNEIAPAATMTALRTGRELGMTTVWNPAPAPEGGVFTDDIFSCIDIMVPNAVEAGQIAGCGSMDADTVSVESITGAARALIERGVGSVVVTMGSRGALILSKGDADAEVVPTIAVTPVDTTGAGDCFTGSLVWALSRGANLKTAVQIAVRIAALSVTRKGTQSSYCVLSDLPAEITSLLPKL